jgi:uncharacterized protein (DUF736 family)
MNLPAEISFIVSQNDKGDNPKRPDYRGEVKIGAATYEVAAWKRTKQGTTKQFISGTLKLKQPKPDESSSDHSSAQSSRPAPPPAADQEEDVPF